MQKGIETRVQSMVLYEDVLVLLYRQRFHIITKHVSILTCDTGCSSNTINGFNPAVGIRGPTPIAPL